jgi:hypothetical protein
MNTGTESNLKVKVITLPNKILSLFGFSLVRAQELDETEKEANALLHRACALAKELQEEDLVLEKVYKDNAHLLAAISQLRTLKAKEQERADKMMAILAAAIMQNALVLHKHKIVLRSDIVSKATLEANWALSVGTDKDTGATTVELVPRTNNPVPATEEKTNGN